MQPDWDMFHLTSHGFNLLKKLVLPDGSILRAKLPGRPCRDFLFTDPTRDGKSLLKIWNLNDYTGVVGVFNCQGAGWCKDGKKILIHDERPDTITGVIRAKDVNYMPTLTDSSWGGDAIAYTHIAGELVYLPKNAFIPINIWYCPSCSLLNSFKESIKGKMGLDLMALVKSSSTCSRYLSISFGSTAGTKGHWAQQLEGQPCGKGYYFENS